MPQGINDFKVSWSWDLCFWSSRGFRQAWSCSKSWCIPNYQLSVSFKNSSFLLPDYEEFEKKFLNQEFYGQLLEQTWSNGLFDFFQKLCLSRHQDFFIQIVPRWKWVFVKITNNDHQFFRESYYQKFWNPFFLSFFCADFMIMIFIPLFRNVNKIS